MGDKPALASEGVLAVMNATRNPLHRRCALLPSPFKGGLLWWDVDADAMVFVWGRGHPWGDRRDGVQGPDDA
jgi:hypothetical protein